MELSELPANKLILTHREARFARARIEGKDERNALLAAGFSYWQAKSPPNIPGIERMRAGVEAMQQVLVAQTIELGLVDAVELHERLSDEYRGDLAELYNPLDPTDPRFNPSYAGGELLPVLLWPMWARNGGVEFVDEPNMVHSDDNGGGSWDQKGRKVKLASKPRHKTAELLMKHKGVNAMVQEKTGDVHLHVHNQIVEALQEARQRQSRLIEAVPLNP